MGELSVIFRAGTHLCALPIEHIVETMRPLPVEPLAGVPPYVVGVCVIRGEPAPVVDAAVLVGGGEHQVTRFLTVKSGRWPDPVGTDPVVETDRRLCVVALAVDAVLGVGDIATDSLHDSPPILGTASRELISALGVLGNEPVLLLRSGTAAMSRLMPAVAEPALAVR